MSGSVGARRKLLLNAVAGCCRTGRSWEEEAAHISELGLFSGELSQETSVWLNFVAQELPLTCGGSRERRGNRGQRSRAEQACLCRVAARTSISFSVALSLHILPWLELEYFIVAMLQGLWRRCGLKLRELGGVQ